MIDEFLASLEIDPLTLSGQLLEELFQTAVKIRNDDPSISHLKIMVRALKEMRYAFSVFERYEEAQKVSVFGSARTPSSHPDYEAARLFSKEMANRGWMSITGAAEGIMKASQEGAGRKNSFGLAIRLPYEAGANSVIEGDEKLMVFRFFFTRKLLFVSQSDALVAFPGGFGTLDELFEVLTLMQTGKASLIPIVLAEGCKEGTFWKSWERFMREALLSRGAIHETDFSFFYLAKSPEDAADHIIRFYRNYHSSRFVRDVLVFRLKSPLSAPFLEKLNVDFADLLAQGNFEQQEILDEENKEHPDLARLVFIPKKASWGRIRELINAINQV